MRWFGKLARSQRGATAVEYGLLCGAVAVAIIASLNNINAGFTSVYTRIGGVFAGN